MQKAVRILAALLKRSRHKLHYANHAARAWRVHLESLNQIVEFDELTMDDLAAELRQDASHCSKILRRVLEEESNSKVGAISEPMLADGPGTSLRYMYGNQNSAPNINASKKQASTAAATPATTTATNPSVSSSPWSSILKLRFRRRKQKHVPFVYFIAITPPQFLELMMTWLIPIPLKRSTSPRRQNYSSSPQNSRVPTSPFPHAPSTIRGAAATTTVWIKRLQRKVAM